MATRGRATTGLVEALLVWATMVAAGRERYVTVHTIDRERQSRLGQQLLELDLQARDRYDRQHPGVLPELQMHVPKRPPKAFDWTTLGKVCGLKKQRTMECWDVGATKALECSEIMVNGIQVDLSPQPVLDAALALHVKHPVAAAPFALDHFQDFGTCTEEACPYSGTPGVLPAGIPMPYRVIAWGFVGPPWSHPPTETFKAALLEYGPLEVGISAGPTFGALKGDRVLERLPDGEKQMGHSILLVGWDDRRGQRGAWKIMNHQDARWGDGGFGWLGYGFTNFGHYAAWVRAASMYYEVPPAANRLLPDATPFPHPTLPLSKR